MNLKPLYLNLTLEANVASGDLLSMCLRPTPGGGGWGAARPPEESARREDVAPGGSGGEAPSTVLHQRHPTFGVSKQPR